MIIVTVTAKGLIKHVIKDNREHKQIIMDIKKHKKHKHENHNHELLLISQGSFWNYK